MGEQIPLHTVTPDRSRFTDSGKIQTRSFTGYFRRLRIIGCSVLFLLFFGTVWLSWGGRQAVLWDLSTRQFHIFGSTFWPEDLVLLSAILIICAFGLFFVTVLAGRVWCGYACPQSVWTWVFLWVEKVTEGDRHQRLRLDNAPMTRHKFLKRARKHALWLLISLATGITFVGYFTPIRELAQDMATLQVGGMALFWVFFFTLATYLNAGWLREKVCLHMCPYGRFQSSMLDEDSLLITYDVARGEPRGARKKEADYRSQGLGDCIDCQMCVQVCPTGIDIRDGLQMECIGCAACIDACDSIMDRMGYDRGLIRYTSERALKGGRPRILRPKLLGYAALLLVMIGAFGWGLVSRPLLTLDVSKDRGLYRYTAGGDVENSYVLTVRNKERSPRTYHLQVAGLEGAQLNRSVSGQVPGGKAVDIPVAISMDARDLKQPSNPVEFRLVFDHGVTVSESSQFTAAVR